MSVLIGSPYFLSGSVHAKVSASNIVGESAFSPVGNGAVITLSFPPDAPILLKRNEELTSQTKLAFSWSDGPSNGG
jgi:hypothetical protein